MGKVIGIDLGTTYSAVTIMEERSGQEGFLPVKECPGCSVILDDFKRQITPSVVAEDNRGNIITGYPAKARAGFSPAPIMFAKRSMGEDVTFQLAKQGSLKPEDVSSHILRYLKQLAEKRLKEPVEEAVITVPAYFGLRAKQMTEEAAKLAGLRVSQIAQEPVAAALMYTVTDTRPSLTIMTYDLGGGTFDVAILEKKQGVISSESVRAFDGDRFLGGYNFDKTLAMWIANELCNQGYDIRLNLDDPADGVIFSKLLIYAERAKVDLSSRDIYEFQVPSTDMLDHSGNPVALNLTLRRDQFEAMISVEVERTIDLCNRALEKAYPDIPLPAERRARLNEIVMVGGSSRIPLVARRLEEEFLIKPKLVNPDLCVALGAGLIAGTRTRTDVGGCLRLDPIPPETSLPELAITGQVIAVEPCAVVLRAADGSFDRTRMAGAEGRFAFDKVPLEEDATTDFILTARSAAGTTVATHKFSVKQTRAGATAAASRPATVTNMLAKPIGILAADGLHVVAPEKTKLPHEAPIPAKTRDTSGTIRIPIYEENNPIGEIVIANIPATLAVGSTVEITISIQENYQIRGCAYLPALAREETVVIDIPVRQQKTVEELRRAFEILSETAEDTLQSVGRGAVFGDARGRRLKQRLAQCGEMLSAAERGEPAEPAAIQDCLDEIEMLVRQLKPAEMKPPRAVFDEMAEESRDLLAKAVQKKPSVAEQGYDKQREAILKDAEEAYRTKNAAVWAEQAKKLTKLCQTLEGLATDRTGGDDKPPNPAEWKLRFGAALTALAEHAKSEGRYEGMKPAFKDAADALNKIDPKRPDALSDLSDWVQTKYTPLKDALDAPDVASLVELVRPSTH